MPTAFEFFLSTVVVFATFIFIACYVSSVSQPDNCQCSEFSEEACAGVSFEPEANVAGEPMIISYADHARHVDLLSTCIKKLTVSMICYENEIKTRTTFGKTADLAWKTVGIALKSVYDPVSNFLHYYYYIFDVGGYAVNCYEYFLGSNVSATITTTNTQT